MSVLGIIVEYNPFHNGHLHLIKEATKKENFQGIICVMSGNFLQRGEPALCHKWARAEMALAAGADLIIELPFCFAVRSAYYFARGGVSLLASTGIVSHIAFGSESGDLEKLNTLADYWQEETPLFKSRLKHYLDQGLNFPAARSRALEDILDEQEDLKDFIKNPNDILGVEYLRNIKEKKLDIKPIVIKRTGSGYHSTELGKIASATAIRQALKNNLPLSRIKESLPETSFKILKTEIEKGYAPVFEEELGNLILFKLRTMPEKDLINIYEIKEGLEGRFKKAAFKSADIEELRQNIKTKRYSMTRINRTLLYALFDFTWKQAQLFDEYGPQYIRILGFSETGQKLLKKIKKTSPLPVISRGSEVKKALTKSENPVLREMLSLDVKAGNIYSLLYPRINLRQGGQDFTAEVVRKG
ncbi:Predicted nucleotidyltransferase [Thermosyntropha lipolytica DSM 11003]|uniref:tRNA(Met) cytidine acetate ligase n=1 Tax=Thermosyntropha lipolytica DSM 11003 TaxID=1123382 RepID=A0A1M5PJC2_9FIRM|nr:nucleotidyltransferase [Thermosyntropha lipolytica]SHH01880.1 Predicted nucleotidyltransferase [Thermosyntropha lipolytica DSM 11003]